MVEVTQADREAAWPFRPSCYGPRDKAGWFAGQYDDIGLIQAFAAHRIAERERCARVAEDWTMDWTRESAHIPSDIAQTIRVHND